MIVDARDERALARVLEPSAHDRRALERRVAGIVEQVRRGGDRALRRFARRLDGWDGPFEMPAAEVRAGVRRVEPGVRRALARTAARIRTMAARELPQPFRLVVAPGVVIERRIRPLERVGCYVPGGRHPLPSSLLMTAIPARAAGVAEIIAVTPRPDPVTLAAAVEAGVDRVFRLGGAHAIAALAYGTGTVPRVDKIVGPGNEYVTAAKMLVSRVCAIDMPAGPTEVVVVADRGDPRWIAADLAAQAEHDPAARSILVTPNTALARAVARRLGSARGVVIVTRTLAEAVALVNRMAPEHVACPQAEVARRITHAGTVFAGPYAAPAAGDYATGANHVLPTGGLARVRGALSAADFVRSMTIQRISRSGLRSLAPELATLAREEGLHAHAHSVALRLRGA